MNGIFHLSGTVKNYAWGGFNFIPELLNISNPRKVPYAEYWIGTHASGPGRVTGEKKELPLSELTGPLSYLLKVLDVREMLSIQVHPGGQGAREGFEEENRRGLAPDDPERRYPDPNEKPELMVALSEFWLLHGFKPTEQLHDVLVNVTELNELLSLFHNRGYEGLYREVMQMPQQEVNRLLQPLQDHIDKNDLSPDTEDYWAARAMRTFSRDGNFDRGIFSIYFFNLVRLEKGEGIFQAPGVPHAYLRGQNVEMMGSSDNVLRGGLTSKPLAVDELLRHVRFEATYPGVIQPKKSHFGNDYAVPSGNFQLSKLDLGPGASFTGYEEENAILLLTEGEATVSNREKTLSLIRGYPALLITGGQEITLGTVKGATIFRARS